jgi:hypothetical protein
MSAEEIRFNWNGESQTTHISKRLRTMAKSAIKYYTQSLTLKADQSADRRRVYLLSVFSGEAIDGAGYHQAQERDRFT